MLKLVDYGLPRLLIFAKTDIPANTEITFHYNSESRKKVNSLLICHCNTSNCSGFIGILKPALNKFLEKNGFSTKEKYKMNQIKLMVKIKKGNQ